MLNTRTLILTTAAAGFFATAVQAEHRYPVAEQTVKVSYRDLNLSDPKDARIMLDRIAEAARKACGIMPQRNPAYRLVPQFVTKDFAACTEAAMQRTVAGLQAPAVARAYAETRDEPRTREARR